VTYSEADLPPLLVERIRSAAGVTKSQNNASQDDLASGSASQISSAPFFDAINMSEAIALYSAVRALRPTHSAEIGFCCGGSGMAILKALQDNGIGTHHVCDPYQMSYAKGAGLSNLETAGLKSRLDFHLAFPESVVPGFPRLQFAFIDASHLFDLSVLDFVLIDKKLDVGGVVAFHDLWMASLQKLTRFILNNRGYKLYTPPGVPEFRNTDGFLRQTVASILRCLPRSDKIFTQELLRPWVSLPIGNVVMFQKLSEDDRDWRHFVRF
jgi:predicted O-methyltransferase YrrM